MTPYELRILLDVFCGSPISVDSHAPIYDATIHELEIAGWIDRVDSSRVTHSRTAKLVMFIDHILATPAPVQKWVFE